MAEISIAINLMLDQSDSPKEPRCFPLERIERARRAVAHYRRLCHEAEEQLFDLLHPNGWEDR